MTIARRPSIRITPSTSHGIHDAPAVESTTGTDDQA